MIKKYGSQNGFFHAQMVIIIAVALVGLGLVGSYVIAKSNASSQCYLDYARVSKVSKKVVRAVYEASGEDGNKIQYVNIKWGDGTSSNKLPYWWGEGTPTTDHTYPAVKKTTTRNITISAMCPSIKEVQNYSRTFTQQP